MKKNKGIQLTDRDKEIFRFMFENRMATAMDITKRFFSQQSRRNVGKRLKKYMCKGLVGVDACHGLKQLYFYFLKNKGLKTIYPQSDFLQGVRLKSPCPVHDSTLMKLRSIFSESRIIHEYYTENMLMADTLQYKINKLFCDDCGLRPDALFVTKTEKREFYNAVELDLTEKSRNRYMELIQRYYLNHKISYVIFISAEKRIEKKVMELENRLYPKGNTKIYYGNLTDLFKKKLPFVFKSCRGAEFELF